MFVRIAFIALAICQCTSNITETPINVSATQLKLWRAVRNGNVTEVERLLDQGANPQGAHRPFLDIAAQNSLYNRFGDMIGLENPWVTIVRILVYRGADPRSVNDIGMTPYQHYIQYVMWYPNPEIERLLNI